MYKPNLAADALSVRLIRYLLFALLTCPLFCACATTARRAIRHEHATSRHHQSFTPVNPTN